MGDSYREAIKKNQKRIRSSNAASDNRAKAAVRAALRKQHVRKSPVVHHKATQGQMRLDA